MPGKSAFPFFERMLRKLGIEQRNEGFVRRQTGFLGGPARVGFKLGPAKGAAQLRPVVGRIEEAENEAAAVGGAVVIDEGVGGGGASPTWRRRAVP